MPAKKRELLEDFRRAIARSVRRLRLERGWTQAELASVLGVSQGRLSELERGDGSFSAEQVLVVLREFNVTIAELVDQRPDPEAALQNALARLGATHLVESRDVLPANWSDDLERTIREALASGSPRLVTALAPVLAKNVERLNLLKLRSGLAEIGIHRRLDWLLDSTLGAIARELRDEQLPRAVAQSYRRVQTELELFRAFVPSPEGARAEEPRPFDLLDAQIRSRQTAEGLIASASPSARRWGIITALTEDDFVEALRASRDDL